MPYKYGWGVEESGKGLNYGQNEESDGSVVTGQYRVLLPDGRTQIVRYSQGIHLELYLVSAGLGSSEFNS